MLRLPGLVTELNIYRHFLYCSSLNIQLRSSTSAQENSTIKPEDNVSPKSKEVDQLLENIKDIPTLLEVVTTAKRNKATYAFQALDKLAAWSIEGKINFTSDVEKDASFPTFVSVIEKHANHKGVIEIIKAIENLKKMGIKCDNFLIESLENDLLWHTRRVNINLLLRILTFQANHLETEKQEKVLETTIDTIERRWTEASHFQNFIKIYDHSKFFKPNFLGHIDDRVIETAEEMNMYELSKVFCSINFSKRRPTAVLRALTFHMFKNNESLSAKQTVNLIFAMNSLNYSDQALLEKLASDLYPQIRFITQSNIVGSLLLCMGKLRWRNKLLLDAIGDWILNNFERCRINDLTNLILAMATVSYMPSSVNESFEKILSMINRDTIPEVATWVDIVWSLVILGKAENDHIASVLSLDVKKVIEVDDPTNVGIHLKILNINSYAKIFSDSYCGPKIIDSAPDELLITLSRKDRSLQSYVQKVLHNFLPPPKYIRENIKTTMGFIVDAEIVVDNLNRPIPVVQHPSNFNVADPSSLPNGEKRVAIMVWNYKDYTIGSQVLAGFNPIVVQILNKLGYYVVQVPYFDVNEKEKIVKSVLYFQRRIKEINDTL